MLTANTLLTFTVLRGHFMGHDHLQPSTTSSITTITTTSLTTTTD